MKLRKLWSLSLLAAAALGLGLAAAPAGRPAQDAQGLDAKIQAFLDGRGRAWYDMNVPAADGRILYDLIVARGYKRALEIGTSTGHSGIWIAWALNKTGGRLITVEIDRERHDEAVRNFKASGLDGRIDARLADAHELVPRLPGPFDFVFCDADKDWYVEYFKAVRDKIAPGGCFAAHNVSERRYGRYGQGAGYLEFVRGLPEFETTVDPRGSASLALSIKKPS